MVAVLEHLVRGAGVHLDEGLEKEFIIFLFVSSVCSGGKGMDDDNVGLFESLHELKTLPVKVFGEMLCVNVSRRSRHADSRVNPPPRSEFVQPPRQAGVRRDRGGHSKNQCGFQI